ncbi:hypothetical protein DFH11DRAFT_1730811 [Phellopilus nigrolimitatus]|nr:hypothetical protein DFH11DRAFT_1730811 [Phellopilus nigrolimitatus]
MKDRDSLLDVQRAARIYLPGRARRYPACGHDTRRRRRDALDPASTRPVQAAEPRLSASDTRMSVDNASTIAQSLQDELSNTASSTRRPPPIPPSQAHRTCPFPLRRAPRSLVTRTPSPLPPTASASPRVPLHHTERPIPAALGYSDTDDTSVHAAAAAAPLAGAGPTTPPRSAQLPGAPRGVPTTDGGLGSATPSPPLQAFTKSARPPPPPPPPRKHELLGTSARRCRG